MAMLAEKRQRTKWSLNPMGNDWSKDENKFGQRMLQKMGWEPGTGLGVRGQGRTDIVKINLKCDTKGLGCEKVSTSDNWRETIVNFDSFLAELNGTSRCNDSEALILPSLEEKSKASRARVHYHKFTRGKDVSKYSSKDLKCILPLSDQKENETELVKCENNMYEYFKNKNKSFDNTEEKNDNALVSEEPTSTEYIENSYINEVEDISLKKKKKKRKNKCTIDETEMTINSSLESKYKKSKSSKDIFSESCMEEHSGVVCNDENEIISEEQTFLTADLENKVNKKSKKKMKKKQNQYNNSENDS